MRSSAQAIAPCEVRAVMTAWMAVRTPSTCSTNAMRPIHSSWTMSIMGSDLDRMRDAGGDGDASSCRYVDRIILSSTISCFPNRPIATKMRKQSTYELLYCSTQYSVTTCTVSLHRPASNAILRFHHEPHHHAADQVLRRPSAAQARRQVRVLPRPQLHGRFLRHRRRGGRCRPRDRFRRAQEAVQRLARRELGPRLRAQRSRTKTAWRR